MNRLSDDQLYLAGWERKGDLYYPIGHDMVMEDTFDIPTDTIIEELSEDDFAKFQITPQSVRVETITEGGKSKKVIIFGGPAQQEDQPNQNKRIYPKKLWDNLFESERFKRRMDGRLLLGLLGHPTPGQGVNYERFTHYTRSFGRGGAQGILEAEHVIIPTPSGQILETYLNCGIRFIG